jgi:ABC-2 type transport system ATP-binding protein
MMTIKQATTLDVRVNSPADAAPKAATAISVQQVSKTYPTPPAMLRGLGRNASKTPVEALSDVSFEIREGEIFGLIGRNGAGKTTLTKIIATLVQPSSGTVLVRGHDSVRHEEQVRRQVGLAGAEERTFYWRLTVEQNLMFFARLYGIGTQAARRRIAELLAQFELESLAGRRFGLLSTGNKQRMAVARALLNSPPVLLLDEPTRSLDPLAAESMRSAISALVRGDPPVTVLLTSHNLTEVENLCDRISIISRGRVRITGTPAEIHALNKPQERVRLVVSGISPAHAEETLALALGEVKATGEAGQTAVTFMREPGDDRLDRGMRALLGNGTRLLAVDSERPTLLNVLESYEQDVDGEEAQ